MTAGSGVAAVRPFLEERHEELATRVEAFAGQWLAPLPAAPDDEVARRQAREILELLGEEGWAAYAVPEEHGGATPELDLRACCLIREALAAASPLADTVFACQCLGAMPIVLGGGEELRRRWLPEVAAGRAMAAFAMTEAQAGSDVRAMKTRAERFGGEYVLDGHKTLISNAGLADFYTVFAVSAPGNGPQGISAFLVAADAPGLRFVGPQTPSDPHPLGEIELTGCRVPAAARLGEEGKGLELGLRTLDRLRATAAAAACGMSRRALAEALIHARQRRQFGRPLSELQLVREKLAIMATELAAARLLTYRAARESDGGSERVTLESAQAKAFATEAAQRIVDRAVQILGGRGVVMGHPVERLYRAVRALRIYEETTEIQNLVIARELLEDGEAEGGEGGA